jgi:hypothetical protein
VLQIPPEPVQTPTDHHVEPTPFGILEQVSAALYLRERASDVRQDDQAMLDRFVTRIDEQMRDLCRATSDETADSARRERSRVVRAAIYARVSTIDQTAENQLLELRRYVEARRWSATEFVDRGISGAKDKRPALDALADVNGAGYDRRERLGGAWRDLRVA